MLIIKNVYQMTNDKSVGCPAMLVNYDKVSDAVGSTGRQQLLELVVTTIEALGIGNN